MVSVVIATHENAELLKKCIESLQNQEFRDLEILVVFNGTPDYLIGEIKGKFPGVISIINNDNLLFCKAYNQGIKLSRGEYILCLNDDAVLDRGFIRELAMVMDLDRHIGSVSGKILRLDRMTIDSAGLFLARSRRPLERGFNQKDRGQFEKEEFIFGVSGAAAFYRREMLEELKNEYGYFDDRYGMFYEDLDLAWRARNKGWRAYYNPRAIAYHYRGASARKMSQKDGFMKRFGFACLRDDLKLGLIRNRYLTMAKNDSFRGVFLNLPFILAYEIRLYLYLLIFSPKLLGNILTGRKS